MSVPNEMPRIFFADTIPIETPERLSDLRGPETGFLDLPLTVYWGPDRHYPIHNDALRMTAYQEILNRASVEELCRFVNENTLRRLWKDIPLPTRVRVLWETKFPELTHA